MTAPRLTFADPIQISIGRVRPKTAQRLGYRLCSICRHCRYGLVVRLDESDWVHKATGDLRCR